VPRYFFNVHDGTDLRDLDGTELGDIYIAQSQAIHMSGEILQEMGAKFWNGSEWRLEVSDENGGLLSVLRFSAEELPPLPGASSPILP